jgi:hypothetical protein
MSQVIPQATARFRTDTPAARANYFRRASEAVSGLRAAAEKLDNEFLDLKFSGRVEVGEGFDPDVVRQAIRDAVSQTALTLRDALEDEFGSAPNADPATLDLVKKVFEDFFRHLEARIVARHVEASEAVLEAALESNSLSLNSVTELVERAGQCMETEIFHPLRAAEKDLLKG